MPVSTLLIEGSFAELAEELAQYLDTLDEGAGIANSIESELGQIREAESQETGNTSGQKAKDDVLKKIITKATTLNKAPEREFSAAYNLLINLCLQSPAQEGFFARLCQYLSDQPVAPNSTYGPSLAISTLTTIFNVLPLTSEARYHVFLAILKVIKATNSAQAFEALVPQLEQNVPNWLSAWQLDEEDAQNLHTTIADVATAQGFHNLSYQYLLKALETIPPKAASEEDSQSLAKRTLITALTNPSITDFTPLTASDAIQALRKTDNDLIELLDIFTSDDYEEYSRFISNHSLSSLDIPESAEDSLTTKIRLLTLASVAAASPDRSVSYTDIASSLKVPDEDVEIWVIDTIRAGLVEGKLSQSKQQFLVQRATYRVFGEKQWGEIQNRLMVWRRSLEGVLGVVRSERERFAREGVSGYEDRPNGYDGQQRRQGGRRQQQPREIDIGGD
ncbi:hypothetical protein LTR05_000697 [Lithohypha guttulata]|uniref:Eukaryotic translation initiation factor 3 subunit M n=1 Tax=Lithohypha guttulata TaxID=1690604 RepID=A0AAN7TCC3_9EURO|nr:hypothetical protein LTR05_000697 [Lithohypha guttulata]